MGKKSWNRSTGRKGTFDQAANSAIKENNQYWKGRATGQAPRMKVCYICGQQFGSASLHIHQKTCLKKFELEQSRLPPEQRRTLVDPESLMDNRPLGASGGSADAYNDAAFAAYQQNLVPCGNCGRTFRPDRLPIHEKSCVRLNGVGGTKSKRPTSSGAGAGSRPTSSGAGAGSRPISSGAGVGARPTSSGAGVGARPTSSGAGAGARPASSGHSAPPPATASTSALAEEPRPLGESAAASRKSVTFAESVDAAPTPEYVPSDADPEENTQAPLYAEANSLVPCKSCGRSFLPDRVGKHEAICAKTGKGAAKKKTSPAKKTPAAAPTKTPAIAAGNKGAKWRAEHEQFMSAIKEARKMKAYEAAGGNIADLPPPPPSVNPDYIQCPHCSRRFNQQAADRHIPICARTLNKPKPPPSARASGSGPVKARSPTAKAASPAKGGKGAGAKANFCVKCGSKFTSAAASFCSSCGASRVTM